MHSHIGHHTPRPKAKENTNVSQDGERLLGSQELNTVNLLPGVQGVVELTLEIYPKYQLLRQSAIIHHKDHLLDMDSETVEG